MKKLHKLIAMGLTVVMTMNLLACGGQEKPAQTAGDNGGGDAKTTQAGTPESPAGTAQAGGQTNAQAVGKKDLVIAIPGEPTTLDPYAHSLYYGFIPATFVFDTLIAVNDAGEYVPELAQEWEFVDDTTLRLKLREGVAFHNGNPLTAEDVAFTLELGATSSFSNALFGCIDYENIEIQDDYNLVVKLKYAYAPLLKVLSSYRASILDKESYEEMGADAYGRTPVGTGPMKLSDWVSGDRIVFAKNDSYWGDPLSFDSCTMRVIVEASARTIELETQGVDMVVDIPFSDWSRVEETQGITLVSGQTDVLASLVFNNSLDLFKDIRIRQALACGIDREALVKTCWEGTADVADSYYAKSLLGHKTESLAEYNPDKAKALLAEAGYPDGLEFTYTTYQTTLNQTFAEVLQSMWSNIGVNIKIDIVDVATYTQMNNNGELTACLLTPSVAISDPAAALILWPITRTISLRHNDQHVQDLLDKGSSAYEEGERTAAYQELQDYLNDQTYTLPVAYTKFAFGIQDYVQGFEFSSSQVPDLTKVHLGQ